VNDTPVRERSADPDDGVEARTTGRTILRRIVTYLPGSLVPAVLTLVTSMVFTRVFSPAVYGMYSLFLVVANPVRLLFTTWLTQSLGKFLPPEHTAQGRDRVRAAVLLSTVAMVLVETVLGVLALVVLPTLLPPGWRDLLLPVVLFVLLTSLFEVLSTVFAVESRAGQYVRYRLFDSVLTLALRLLMVSAVFRMDVSLMFWSVVLSNGVLIPWMWARSGLARPTRAAAVLRTPGPRRLTASFLGFGLPMTLWFFASVLLDVGDRYVISWLLGPAAVGIYDANYRMISGFAALMVVPVTITLHPYLMSVSGSGDRREVGRLIGTITENMVLAGGLFVGLTYVVREDLARIALGEEFRAGNVVMPIVLAGVFVFNIGTVVHKPFEIVGRPRVMVVLAVVAAAANIGACLLLIPFVGYVGAAYATLAGYLLYVVWVGLLGRRVIPWRLDPRRLARHGGVVVGGVAAVLVLRRLTADLPYVWDLLVTLVAAAVVTGVFLAGLFGRRVLPVSTLNLRSR
jgi:O-antigen/teichoic acid export membrane protein